MDNFRSRNALKWLQRATRQFARVPSRAALSSRQGFKIEVLSVSGQYHGELDLPSLRGKGEEE